MKGILSNFLIILVILLLINHTIASCPKNIKEPCICQNNDHEPLQIYCEGATSFTDIMEMLKPVRKTIESLSIVDTSIPKLEENVFDGFIFKKLSLIHNDLTEIDENAFSGDLLESLEELEIRRNSLDEIPIAGISKLKYLTLLSLAENEIATIHDNVFLHYQSRTTIQTIDLSMNQISVIYDNAFLGLENIVTLLLDRNSITEIPITAFLNIPTIEQIGLSVNKIKELIEGLSLPVLKSFSIEANQIKSISQNAFTGTPNLIYLYIGSNQLTNIDEVIFKPIFNLKTLALSNNPLIKEIGPLTFKFTPNLIRLDLSQCGIRKISDLAFTYVNKLQIILLNGNALTYISNKTFTSLKKIENIDLKNNQLTVIEDGSFIKLKHLRTLDLSNNKLTFVSPNMFQDSGIELSSQKQTNIYLYDNLWTCDSSFEIFRQWLRNHPFIKTETETSKPARCFNPPVVKGLELRKISQSMLPPLVSEQTQRTINEFKNLVQQPVKVNNNDSKSTIILTTTITTDKNVESLKIGNKIPLQEKKIQQNINLVTQLHAYPNIKSSNVINVDDNNKNNSTNLYPENISIASQPVNMVIVIGAIVASFIAIIGLIVVILYIFRTKKIHKRQGAGTVSADEFAHKKHTPIINGQFNKDTSMYGNNFSLYSGFSAHNLKANGLNTTTNHNTSDYNNDNLNRQNFDPEGGYYLDRPWYWWF
ncbi:Leucine-rich repeat and Leucine-rich repeat, typical subtype-containing protein [Strongyloides ratti]|uniref:Leucine-rich repeat and Leucine-rich repeat, typical subtype-containing protein n=1 Tax=Strongyloides ratti TaxID=34506 RepID=A0A090LRZ7_STRRB|nr:Leucine-rich repeat and Leucine-rich repeat, typical subtype-containing protein [Strongyloides ratti]CEF70987.1 Leucine-rich repeat and Leucine-rich repeat, typical subtype-containing protein [Strongyloides ratti]